MSLWGISNSSWISRVEIRIDLGVSESTGQARPVCPRCTPWISKATPGAPGSRSPRLSRSEYQASLGNCSSYPGGSLTRLEMAPSNGPPLALRSRGLSRGAATEGCRASLPAREIDARKLGHFWSMARSRSFGMSVANILSISLRRPLSSFGNLDMSLISRRASRKVSMSGKSPLVSP